MRKGDLRAMEDKKFRVIKNIIDKANYIDKVKYKD